MQITVDDKGLAMIFVFGLPGYQCSKVSMPCLQAGRKVVAMMSAAGLACTAGVTMGMCFCGLVGDPSIRCEYMVMGGAYAFPSVSLLPGPPRGIVMDMLHD